IELQGGGKVSIGNGRTVAIDDRPARIEVELSGRARLTIQDGPSFVKEPASEGRHPGQSEPQCGPGAAATTPGPSRAAATTRPAPPPPPRRPPPPPLPAGPACTCSTVPTAGGDHGDQDHREEDTTSVAHG